MWNLVYLATVAGDAMLLNALWRKRVYRTHPAFVAFIGLALIRAVAMWPQLATGHRDLYGQMFWYSELFYLALLGWVVGEMWKRPSYGLIAGMATGFLILVMIRASFALYVSHREYAWALALTEISADRWAGFIAAGFAFLRTMRRESARTAGVAVACVAHSIVMDAAIMRPSSNLAYASVAGWTIALLLWLGWARTYRAVSRATGTNHEKMFKVQTRTAVRAVPSLPL